MMLGSLMRNFRSKNGIYLILNQFAMQGDKVRCHYTSHFLMIFCAMWKTRFENQRVKVREKYLKYKI